MAARFVGVVFLLLIAARPASAHAMRMTVIVDKEKLTVKTTYSGDDHDGGDVMVKVTRLPGNESVAEGKVGAGGYWSTAIPPAGDYRIVAQDDFGHRAEQVVTVAEAKDPTEYRANEAPVSEGWGVALGLSGISLVTLAGYWFLSRGKKPPVS